MAQRGRKPKQIEHLGTLTETDMVAFIGYCEAYASGKEAEEFITKHDAIVKTPSSRSRIITDLNENEDDKMELLLFNGGGKNV